MKRKKLIEQLKKLRTLSERGATEHERDTAQRMFDTICQTHGIALHEIVDVREVRFFDLNEFEYQGFEGVSQLVVYDRVCKAIRAARPESTLVD